MELVLFCPNERLQMTVEGEVGYDAQMTEQNYVSKLKKRDWHGVWVLQVDFTAGHHS